jgi:hypothetical protein
MRHSLEMHPPKIWHILLKRCDDLEIRRRIVAYAHALEIIGFNLHTAQEKNPTDTESHYPLPLNGGIRVKAFY